MEKTVIDYLKVNSEKYGEKAAVVCEDNHITFKELYDKVLATGRKISEKYADEKAVFAIENKRSIETIVLMLSVVASGKVYRVVDSVDEASEDYIILDESYIEEGCVEDSCEEGFFWDAYDLSEAYALPMYEICTSGTTGEARKIVKSQRDLLEFIEDFTEKFKLDERDVFLNQLEFTFDASTKDIYCMVMLGATLHIASRRQLNFPTEFVKYIGENNITVFITTPFFIKNIAKLKGLNAGIFEKLEYVMFVGENMKSEYLNYWIENMKFTTFVNLYGSSELAGNSLYYVANDKVESKLVPLKECFLDYEYHIEEGQLVLLRASRKLIYKTGDMAETSVGKEIFLVGRRDNIRKIRGYRISLENVEKEVAKVSPVKEALCEQYEDSIYALITSDEEVDMKLLQKELQNRLPKYIQPLRLKQVAELPVNTNGKSDRKKIMEYFKVQFSK